MTPRDKLIEDIVNIVHLTRNAPMQHRYPNLIRLLAGTLKRHYAVGKWVSVSERLPDTGKRTYWDGMVLNDGTVDTGTFGEEGSFRPEYLNTTHWLELDMPEVSR